MRGKFEATRGKRRILRILAVFAVALVGIAGHLRGVEGAISGGSWPGEGRILTDNEAEEVRAIWRVIGDQEIVTWDGKEWLAKREGEKREAVRKAREAWREAGYQDIESVDSFIKDVNKYYRHAKQENSKELETKVGMVASLHAFFGGMQKRE